MSYGSSAIVPLNDEEITKSNEDLKLESNKPVENPVLENPVFENPVFENPVVEKPKKNETLSKEITPSDLRITLTTSIPGYQKIEYSPNMTIPSIKDEKVCFNPLIQLNKSKIDQVPKDIRIREFFNKGLFTSLMYFHGSKPVDTFKEAIDNGYVDSNIKTTLDTIFPTNSVIYVSGNPYVIVDVLWTRGDWRLGGKPINVNRLAHDKYVSSIIKDELISGQKLLADIPVDLKFGPNFVDDGTAMGINPTTAQPTIEIPTTVQPPTAQRLTLEPPPAAQPKSLQRLTLEPPPTSTEIVPQTPKPPNMSLTAPAPTQNRCFTHVF